MATDTPDVVDGVQDRWSPADAAPKPTQGCPPPLSRPPRRPAPDQREKRLLSLRRRAPGRSVDLAVPAQPIMRSNGGEPAEALAVDLAEVQHRHGVARRPLPPASRSSARHLQRPSPERSPPQLTSDSVPSRAIATRTLVGSPHSPGPLCGLSSRKAWASRRSAQQPRLRASRHLSPRPPTEAPRPSGACPPEIITPGGGRSNF